MAGTPRSFCGLARSRRRMLRTRRPKRLIFFVAAPFFDLQQKAVRRVIRIVVDADDVSASINSEVASDVNLGKVHRCRGLAIVSQKTMLTVINSARPGSAVVAHDIATRIDPALKTVRCSIDGAWKVNRRELSFAESEDVRLMIFSQVAPDDLASRVDAPRIRPEGLTDVNRYE